MPVLDIGIRDRLQAALDASGHSRRSCSVAAGLGSNYLQQMLDTGREPGIENLMSICKVLNVSLGHIVYGSTVTPEEEVILHLAARLTQEERRLVMGLMLSMRPDEPVAPGLRQRAEPLRLG